MYILHLALCEQPHDQNNLVKTPSESTLVRILMDHQMTGWSMASAGLYAKSFTPCPTQTTMPAPRRLILTGRMNFLVPNQQRQSTEGKQHIILCYV